jgi:hypothetical protein
MILRHSGTFLTCTAIHNSEGMVSKTWTVLKTKKVDVQPAALSENEVKLFGISSQGSNAKRVYYEQDSGIIEGLRLSTGGELYEVRGVNPWSIHGVCLAIPVVGETYP